MALTAATLLLVGCFSSRKGTKDGNTVLATEDPFAKTDEVTINFKKFKGKDWHYPLEGAKVISPFGGKRPNHKGTDIKTKAKRPQLEEHCEEGRESEGWRRGGTGGKDGQRHDRACPFRDSHWRSGIRQ